MENPQAERIQAEYLKRLRGLLKRAPAKVREDAVREVQSHIEDEWEALGGDLPALQAVLQHLGPPEAYGRDLALQLMLLRERGRNSPAQLILAALFWASTSLIGSVVVLCAMFFLGFALGMVFVAVERLIGNQAMLIDAFGFQVMGFYAERVRFPSETWSPAFIALVGLLPALLVFSGLYRFLSLWVRSRLAERGLAILIDERAQSLPKGWERRAILAMAVFAVLSLSSCMLFAIISDLLPIGHPASVSLPEDFFRTLLTAFAFLSGLIFICSPVLGLLWTARRAGKSSEQ